MAITAYQRRKQESRETESSKRSTPCGPDEPLRRNQLARYNGSYAFLGRVVHVTRVYAVLLDADGRFCRIVRGSPDAEILPWNYPDLDVERLAMSTDLLLMFQETSEAISRIIRADHDPADFDRWLLPLAQFATNKPLTHEAARYYAWPANTRRAFEASVGLIQGVRQRETYLKTVLGRTPSSEIKDRYGITGDSAVRMARLRARSNVRRTMGHAVE